MPEAGPHQLSTRSARASWRPPARGLLDRWRYLPTARKLPLWRLATAPLDLLDRLRPGRASKPPRWLQMLVGGDFDSVGDEYLHHLRQLGGLQPHEAVLDIGCGAGRIALPLVDYMHPPGSYDGLDIVPEAVAWCSDHISRDRPEFRFQLLDIYNGRYRPTGSGRADQASLPYSDGTFDLVLAASLFTHLEASECRRYLQETRRVMRTGGRTLVTFFLQETRSPGPDCDPSAEPSAQPSLEPTAEPSTVQFGEPSAEPSAARFFQQTGMGIYTPRGRPGDAHFAVAYAERLVRGWFRDAGLEIVEPIMYGSWRTSWRRPAGGDAIDRSGSGRYCGFQDMVLATAGPWRRPKRP